MTSRLAVFVAVVVIGACLVACGGGRKAVPAAESPAATETSAQSASAARPATVPAPTPTPTQPPPPAALAGLPIARLTAGPDEGVPPGKVYFYAELLWEKWPTTLYRTWVDAKGVPHTRDLFEDLRARFPRGSGPYSWAGDATMGELLASVCPAGACGQGIRAVGDGDVARIACHTEGCAEPRRKEEGLLFHSADGGITWEEAGTLHEGDRIAAWGPGGPIIASVKFNDDGTTGRDVFTEWRSGGEVTAPAADAYPENVPGSGELIWETGRNNPSVFGWQGDLKYAPSGDPSSEAWIGPVAGGSLAAWAYNDPALVRGRLFLVWLNSGFEPTRALEVEDRSFDFWRSALLGEGLVLVRGSRGNDYRMYRVDLAAGTYHAIPEIDAQVATIRVLSTWINRAVAGDWAEVSGTGSCLVLRAEPSTRAAQRACYADGVLLEVDAARASTSAWLAVTGPDGRTGWVSSEFVSR